MGSPEYAFMAVLLQALKQEVLGCVPRFDVGMALGALLPILESGAAT